MTVLRNQTTQISYHMAKNVINPGKKMLQFRKIKENKRTITKQVSKPDWCYKHRDKTVQHMLPQDCHTSQYMLPQNCHKLQDILR